MAHDAYRDAGVDIDAADGVIDAIKRMVGKTRRQGVLSDIGGFGGLFSLEGRYRDPVLVSGTDGVGTKLLVAQKLNQHDTIGIDLVAMCVNDVLVSGAEPLFFLDYFATGKLEPSVTESVVAGIVEGCRQSGCALIGGEIAEMPGMYAPGHYDLAGFVVGAVERDAILDGSRITAGDVVLGLPSNGLHSNGFSLVRSVVDELDWDQRVGERTLADELLVPTRIYAPEAKTLREQFDVRGMAHITGGGLVENIPRVLPDGCGARLNRAAWTVPPIFELIQQHGALAQEDMDRTFNNGIGLVAIVPADRAPQAAASLGAHAIGEVVADSRGAVDFA